MSREAERQQAIYSRQYLTPQEVADELGVCVEHVHRWIKAGELRAMDVRRVLGQGRAMYRIKIEWMEQLKTRRMNAARTAA